MKNISKHMAIFIALTLIVTLMSGFTGLAEAGKNTEQNIVLNANERAISEIEEKAIDEFEEKSSIQKEALEAYETMYSAFEKDKSGFTIYPDDYAGAWIEGSILHIALISDDNETANKYNSIFEEFNCVEYQIVEYSLNELQILQDSAYETFNQRNNVVAYYTSVENNKIVFEFENLDISNLKKILISEINSEVPFGIKLDKIIDDNLFIFTQGERIQTTANIYGGMPIERGSASGPTRSIGMCGTTVWGGNTIPAIITAGHNYTIGDAVYRNNSLFGYVNKLMYQNNGYGDYAVVRVTSGDTMTNKVYGSSTSYTRSMTGTSSNPPAGTYVMRFGENTGYGNGEIKGINVTINDGTHDIKGMTKCDGDLVDGGDSGGPFYVSGYNFAGVTEGHSSTHNYFTPFTRFSSSFTPKTN